MNYCIHLALSQGIFPSIMTPKSDFGWLVVLGLTAL